MKKKFLGLVALSCVITFMSSCSDESSSSSTNSGDVENLDPAKETPAYKELNTNFTLLDLLYFYGHSRDELADDVDAYFGKGSSKDAKDPGGQTACTKEYYDVCYMYNQMADAYTHYYDPSVAPMIAEQMMASGDYDLVGIESEPSEIEDGLFVITSVSDEAKELGLRVGDVYGLGDVYQGMEDAESDTISMYVLRDGEIAEVKAVVGFVSKPTVYLHYEKNEKGDSIPVIQITEFSSQSIDGAGTYEEFKKALKQTEKYKSLIIDLRENGGGDIEECYPMTAEFLAKGDTSVIDVVTDVGSVKKDGKTKLVQIFDTTAVVAEKDGSAKDRYLVMLENDWSASCSEVLLSALGISKKAPIVGELSYGKQIGQFYVFGNEEGLMPDFLVPEGLAIITTIVSYDKNWGLFQDVGIVPDFEISDPDEQMAKAVELATEAKYERTAGYGKEKLGHFSKEAERAGGKLGHKVVKPKYRIIR